MKQIILIYEVYIYDVYYALTSVKTARNRPIFIVRY